MEAGENKIDLLVNASSSGNLSPGFIMEIFEGEYEDIAESSPTWQITRTELYGNNGTEEEPVFVPLSDYR